MSPNDIALIQRWNDSKDPDAFAEIVRQYSGLVYGACLRVLRNSSEAEDVVQECFMKISEAPLQINTSFGGWLHTVATRRAINRLRSDSRRAVRETKYAASQADSFTAAWDDVQHLIDEAIAALPEEQRIPLIEHYLMERTLESVGKEMGITRQAVSRRVQKAIESIRAELRTKGVPVASAIVATGLGAMATAQAAATLQKGLIQAAIGGIDGQVLGQVATAKASASAFSYLAYAVVASVIAVAGLGVWFMKVPASVPPTVTQDIPPIPKAEVSKSISDEEGVATSTVTDQPENKPFKTQSITETAPTPASSLASVLGIVTLPDGKPFAGAKIRFSNTDYLEEHNYPKNTNFQLTIDAQGRFEHLEIPPAEYSITLSEPDDNSWSTTDEFARITLKANEHREDLDFVFGTEGNFTISGVVVDSKDRPLEGVRVHKFAPAKRASLTDKNGRFTLRYLPDDDIRVFADKKGYRGQGISTFSGDQDAKLILFGDGSIEGKVVDASTGKAIPKFELSYMNGHAPQFHESLFGNKKDLEHPNGEFHIDKVYAGDLTVVARAPGYAPVMLHTTVFEEETAGELVFNLDKTVAITLRGSVITEDGRPVSNANIYMDRLPSPFMRERYIKAVTDEHGKFSIENVPPGIVFLTSWHPDFAPGNGNVTEDHEVTIILSKAGQLNIELFSEGVPSPKTQVRVQYLRNVRTGYINGGITDNNGLASIDEIIPGKILIQIVLSENRTQFELTQIEAGEEKNLRFDIEPGVGEVDGFLYNDGVLATEGEVTLYVQTANSLEKFTQYLYADGSFVFKDVPLGKARIMGWTSPNYRRTFIDDVSLEAGKVTSLTLDCRGERKISAEISGALENETVWVMVLRGSMNFDEASYIADHRFLSETEIAGYLQTSETGEMVSSPLPPGTYTLLLQSFPKGDTSQMVYHESRVIEVSENEDFVANFTITP